MLLNINIVVIACNLSMFVFEVVFMIVVLKK
jgi:hypothetical protein